MPIKNIDLEQETSLAQDQNVLLSTHNRLKSKKVKSITPSARISQNTIRGFTDFAAGFKVENSPHPSESTSQISPENTKTSQLKGIMEVPDENTPIFG